MDISGELRQSYNRLCQLLASNRSVLNVGMGFREEHGRLFDDPSLRVYLRRGCELPLGREFEGIPLSYIVPQLRLLGTPVDPGHHPTLIGGIKIGSFLASGTLGAIVEERQTKEKLGLTCAHVVGFNGATLPSAPIYQPDFPQFIAGSPLNPTNSLGGVTRIEGASFPAPTFPPQFMGVVDAAVFKLDGPQTRPFSKGVTGLVNAITAVADPHPGQVVSKRGFVTGLTHGLVISVSPNPVPWTVFAAAPNSFLSGQAEIVASGFPTFGEVGDSGSLVVLASTSTAVGLLWAGGGINAFMSPIKLVEQRLNISVAW